MTCEDCAKFLKEAEALKKENVMLKKMVEVESRFDRPMFVGKPPPVPPSTPRLKPTKILDPWPSFYSLQ